MKVLVLEDEFHVLKGAFDYLNYKYCNGSLEVESHSKTQDFTNYRNVNSYDKIFVDINFHRSSEQDGYSFIKSLKSVLNTLKKVVVITGSDKVNEKLSEEGIEGVEVLKKPVTFLDLKKVMSL